LADPTGLYICTITGFGSTDAATFDDAVQEATNECFERWLAGAEGQFFVQRPGYYASGGTIPQWAIRNVYAELGGVTRVSLIGWDGPTDCESAFGSFLLGAVDDIAFVATGGAQALGRVLTGAGRAIGRLATIPRWASHSVIARSRHRARQSAGAAAQRGWNYAKDEIKGLHRSPGTYTASSASDFLPFVNTGVDAVKSAIHCL